MRFYYHGLIYDILSENTHLALSWAPPNKPLKYFFYKTKNDRYFATAQNRIGYDETWEENQFLLGTFEDTSQAADFLSDYISNNEVWEFFKSEFPEKVKFA